MPKAIFVAIIVAVSLLSSQAFAERIFVKGAKARLRSGPGTQYQVLWESPKFTPLEYLAKYKDWYAVRDMDGDVAWVSQEVIGKGSAAIVIKKKANIRKGPGTKNPIIFSVEEGYRFKVTGAKGSWYKVKDEDGDEGWVLDKLIWVSR